MKSTQSKSYSKVAAERARKIEAAEAEYSRRFASAQADLSSGKITAKQARGQTAIARESRDRKIAAAKGYKAKPTTSTRLACVNGRCVKVPAKR
jgi:hypothetical protein